ncbi:hypothetical protein MASR1M12_19140 [Erysipelotrichia bacterium]
MENTLEECTNSNLNSSTNVFLNLKEKMIQQVEELVAAKLKGRSKVETDVSHSDSSFAYKESDLEEDIEAFEFVRNKPGEVAIPANEDYVEILKQKWEGIVRGLNDSTFSATLFGFNNDSDEEEEEVKIPFRLISSIQRSNLKIGTRFYLYIGEKQTSKGQRVSYSKFLIKTFPRISPEKIKQKVSRFLSVLKE